jgi:UDP-3-O-[3-hydroxymyristoyl] glucosamine N-acyltransferase
VRVPQKVPVLKLTPSKTLGELARHAEGVIRSRLTEVGSPELEHTIAVEGDKTVISALCPIEDIEPGGLTFAVNEKYVAQAEKSGAAAVVITSFAETSLPCIKAPAPRLVFSVLLELLQPKPSQIPAADGNIRFKDPDQVRIGPGATIGDFCHIGRNVVIGAGCRIYPHVFIDDDVVLGDDVVVYPHVTIFRNTRIGRRVIIHAGAVIGDDGFGYNQVLDLEKGRLYHLKNEHIGGVVIEDFVEIGSQVCIDRGLAGMTVIGQGTKIDNLVQIAHNCHIGQDCIVVAQVGMAGHVQFGNRVFALGQAGFGPGVSIGDDAIIGGQSGVSGNIPAGSTMWTGKPAQKADVQYKQLAMVRRDLPRVRDFFRLLKKAESLQELKETFFGSDKKQEKSE